MPRPGLPSLLVVAVATASLAFAPAAFAGDPLNSIKVNEVESEGPADFIELGNMSGTATDVSGLVLKDNNDASSLVIPGGTSIPANGFMAFDTDVGGGFALGASDSARVFMPDGITLIDGHTWTAHAAGSLSRCPDRTGRFIDTATVTKGAANACPPTPSSPWPGGTAVATVDPVNQHDGNLSGLEYEESATVLPDTIWAVDNGNAELLFRLVKDGTEWVPDQTNNWENGKTLRFPGGTGEPDAEGVTITDAGSAAGVFVSSERDGGGVSKPSILRYDDDENSTTLSATREWVLTTDLPAVESNAGAETVEWVPDSYLVASGFFDEAADAPYNPATYPDHGNGLFFVGLEGNGIVYAYALNQSASTFTRVATFASGFPGVMGLHFDTQTNQLWVLCDNDNGCAGRSRRFEVSQSGVSDGTFAAVAEHARPAGMANLNNEGFTMPGVEECVDGSKPAFWADDSNTGGHSLRAGTVNCTSPPTVGADFNGDGYADLAVGVPFENVGDVNNAGIVQILYGGPGGLSAAGSESFSQDRSQVPDVAENGDHFGDAVATGDFNGDGLSDLAVGVPNEGSAEEEDIGIVQIFLGSQDGLTAVGSKSISQDTAAVADTTEEDDRFGSSLAAGDLAGTAHDDLVVGVPFEDGAAGDTGAVHVLRGSATGVTGTDGALWTQNTGGILDAAEQGDRFGHALAIGNLGGTSDSELAIGAPGETISGFATAGLVHVLPGSASGPTDTGNERFFQDRSGVPDASETFDSFGAALIMGDFDGDGRDDLAVGVPGESIGAAGQAGAVLVLPGSPTGATATGSKQWTQDSGGITDAPGSGNQFGFALAAADFGSTSHDDLAIGVPGEGVNVGAGGAVHLLLGGASGLTSTGAQFWHQDRAGIAEVAENDDSFGGALAAGTYGAGIRSALAAGVPGEVFGADTGVGGLNVIYGGDPGLITAGNKFFSQNTAGVPDTAENGDGFASALG